jgi:hypothetical protein
MKRRHDMKKTLIVLVMAFFGVAGFSGIALSGGGPNPGSTCDLLATHPELSQQGRAGKNASGTYIAWEVGDVIVVQVMLVKDKAGHAFEFTTDIGAGICDPNLTDEELLMRMSQWPCTMDIQQDFFPDGEWQNYFPLLVDVSIKARDCAPAQEGVLYSSPPTISGEVVVRLVPLKF